MGARDVAAAFERAERLLRARPSTGDHADEPAIARWDGGVRCRIDDGHCGVLITDLPPALGGENAAPPPGWLLRAGLAACLNACIAATAAREGIELTALEVEARSRSDARGMFLLAAPDGAVVDPGPHDLELIVRIAAPAASPDRLQALVDYAHAMSPVSAALLLSRPIAVKIEADD